jgi:hypothetical protein
VARVERQERITVPAGSFDTYVITLQTDRIGTIYGTSQFQTRTMWWYAPAVGWNVKQKYEVLRGDPKTEGWEIVTIKK